MNYHYTKTNFLRNSNPITNYNNNQQLNLHHYNNSSVVIKKDKEVKEKEKREDNGNYFQKNNKPNVLNNVFRNSINLNKSNNNNINMSYNPVMINNNQKNNNLFTHSLKRPQTINPIIVNNNGNYNNNRVLEQNKKLTVNNDSIMHQKTRSSHQPIRYSKSHLIEEYNYNYAPTTTSTNINHNTFSRHSNAGIFNLNNSTNNNRHSIGYNPNISQKEERNSPKIVENKRNFNFSAKSVTQYASKLEPNINYRPYMEDFVYIIDGFNSGNNGLFTLYDGHGGTTPANYLTARFPEIFKQFLRETNKNTEKALHYAFQKADDELKILKESNDVGTTLTVVYIEQCLDVILGQKKIVHCANVGDSRAILISKKGPTRLSYDHKATDEKEVLRVKSVGGVVFNGRIMGQLAVSRALGDHNLKKHGLSSTPSITKQILNSADLFIVICSDGVWDVVNDQEMFTLVTSNNKLNCEELSELIVNESLKRGSIDNISCIVIKV